MTFDTPEERQMVLQALQVYRRELYRIRVVEDKVLRGPLDDALANAIDDVDAKIDEVTNA